MKKIFFKLFVSVITAAVCLFGFDIPFSSAESSAICTPTVTKATVTKTTAVLKISCANLKNKKSGIKVQITNNDDDDSDTSQTFKKYLTKKGNVEVKLTGLESGTSYNFKVKMRKYGSSKYSAYSAAVEATTNGADYEPKIDSVKDETEDSVKLQVSCEDLEDKAVNVKVAYRKKSTWSTKTYDLTLDSDGEGTVTVDGLRSGTDYDFKVKIKENGDTHYSPYSSTSKGTTEEDN